jgi:hypothetical protein
MVRLHQSFLTELDTWIKQQDEPLSRPAAIRQIVQGALGRKGKT